MALELHLDDIGRIIQLAIAPVFLLTGVGTNLAVLINRLARVIDRTRVLEDRLRVTGEENEESKDELRSLFRRAHLINYAITLSTSAALLICLLIAVLFIGAALELSLAKTISALFVLAMLALIGSFSFFLREIFVATRTMYVQHERFYER